MAKEEHSNYQNRNISIAKSTIIDQLYLATAIFGTVAVFLTAFRDQETLTQTNILSALNVLSMVTVITVYLCRNRLNYKAKSIILVVVFVFLGTRNLHFFGNYYSAYLFFIFSTFIFTLIGTVRQTLYYIACITSVFIVYACIYVYYGLEPAVSFNYMMHAPMQWVTGVSIFIAFNFFILLGVGQFNKELAINFLQLEKRNKNLEHAVAEKELAQYELILSEKKFKDLFDNSRDAILLFDQDGNVKASNPMVAEMSGYQQEEFFNFNIFSLVPDNQQAILESRLEKLFDGEVNEPFDLTITQKNGQKKEVEINSTLLINDRDVSILSTVRDVSIRKRLEQEKYRASFAAEEKERVRFSRDLHDELGPVFSTIKLYLGTLQKGEQDEKRLDIFDKVVNMVDGSVKQIREISHNLSPYLLQNEGLDQAIKYHINRFTAINHLDINYDLNDQVKERLPDHIELIVYRIFLELLNNTVKHSSASRVNIYIKHLKESVEFHYIDNGNGFDARYLKPSAGIGLKNITNRIEAIEGQVEFYYKDNLMNTLINIPL